MSKPETIEEFIRLLRTPEKRTVDLCDDAADELERLDRAVNELRRANHTLRGLVDVVLDADEFNGHDVSKADRELRLPKAWITEARKAVGDE